MSNEQTRVCIDLVSDRHHHGSRGAKARNLRSGVAGKFRAIKSNPIETEASAESVKDKKENGSTEDPKDLFKYNPKVYGSHNGNTHVDRFYDKTYDSISEAITSCDAVVANSSAKLESLPSVDIRAMKKTYADHKQVTLRSYQETNGSSISPEKLPVISNKLAEKSFDYCSHQIRVTVVSKSYFVGSKSYQKADGSFVYQAAYLSKTYYTSGKGLLSDSLRRAFRQLSQDEVIKIKTTKARCVCHIVTDIKGRYTISFDNDLGFYQSSAREDDY